MSSPALGVQSSERFECVVVEVDAIGVGLVVVASAVIFLFGAARIWELPVEIWPESAPTTRQVNFQWREGPIKPLNFPLQQTLRALKPRSVGKQAAKLIKPLGAAARSVTKLRALPCSAPLFVYRSFLGSYGALFCHVLFLWMDAWGTLPLKQLRCISGSVIGVLLHFSTASNTACGIGNRCFCVNQNL